MCTYRVSILWRLCFSTCFVIVQTFVSLLCYMMEYKFLIVFLFLLGHFKLHRNFHYSIFILVNKVFAHRNESTLILPTTKEYLPMRDLIITFAAVLNDYTLQFSKTLYNCIELTQETWPFSWLKILRYALDTWSCLLIVFFNSLWQFSLRFKLLFLMFQ